MNSVRSQTTTLTCPSFWPCKQVQLLLASPAQTYFLPCNKPSFVESTFKVFPFRTWHTLANTRTGRLFTSHVKSFLKQKITRLFHSCWWLPNLANLEILNKPSKRFVNSIFVDWSLIFCRTRPWFPSWRKSFFPTLFPMFPSEFARLPTLPKLATFCSRKLRKRRLLHLAMLNTALTGLFLRNYRSTCFRFHALHKPQEETRQA